MNRESVRRELRRAFEAMSGQPSPALSARVRGALLENTPERRRGPVWAAGLAAALIAALLVSVLVVSNFNRHQPNVAPGGGPSPSPSAVQTPIATPAQSPTPTSSLPAFECTAITRITKQQSLPVIFINDVRTGTHTGYDRFTITFQNGQPMTIEVHPQTSANFTQGASGAPVTLQGRDGLLIIIRGADEHTAYSGPIDFKPGYAELREARQVEDFEGIVQWGLGLASTTCYRAFILTNPVRLVIDVQVS